MTKEQIKDIIDRYALFRVGDKVATKKKGVDKEAFVSEVGPAKQEIIAYFLEEEKARNEEYERKERNEEEYNDTLY